MKKLITISVMLGSMIFYTTAQVIHVPGDHATIQAAINAASAGDTVLVDDGTYYENINFLGKAITVASQYILDGDTSHISHTIIDGSQATHPDSASVVTFCSGEDTTSVLMGFTITGGEGTYLYDDCLQTYEMGGGGLFIYGSGGKIINNIIEGNSIEINTESDIALRGGGLYGFVFNNHFLIIRDNIIKDNQLKLYKGKLVAGGGLHVKGGGILLENNQIINNSISNFCGVFGGGMMVSFIDYTGVIKSADIRNNLISGNSATTSDQCFGGGGYSQHFGYGENNVRVYNNIIVNNHSNWIAGGVLFLDHPEGRFFNNTIINNTVDYYGNNIYAAYSDCRLTIYNNIIWSFDDHGKLDVDYYDVDNNLHFINNILMKQPIAAVTSKWNQYDVPLLDTMTFNLTEGSPGIGSGLDSFLVGDSWFHAPLLDYYGKNRIECSDDKRIDLGAIESSYNGQTWYDSEHVINVPVEQPTIQAGINAASEGDTVLVSEGLYYENINFIGKAITVASKYIMDEDTSHISRTIIDGSQAIEPDSASVVTFCSGEDTTSVLMGFTITGGTGTHLFGATADKLSTGGGGILILKCGGKIVYNVIEENHIQNDGSGFWNISSGAGVFAWTLNYHTAVIRNNLIRNNTVGGGSFIYGVGVGLHDGRILFENNEVANNLQVSMSDCVGGGLWWGYMGIEDATAIPEIFIRNNYIHGNKIIGTGDWENGGGVAIGLGDHNIFEFSNNIIRHNYCPYRGGGIWTYNDNLTFNNNTIFNNHSETDLARQIVLNGNAVFFNNIIWDDINSGTSSIGYWNNLYAFSNVFQPDALVNMDASANLVYGQNVYMNPLMDTISFMPGENSPAIGRGADSILIGSTWYFAPATDFYGRMRPDPVDGFMDIGAVESDQSRPVLHNADLVWMGKTGLTLYPEFSAEITDYLGYLDDGSDLLPLEAIPADYLATVEITYGEIESTLDLNDSTATIMVTADDGTTKKTYTLKGREVGIKDQLSNNFSLYPNPVSDLLNIVTLVPGCTLEIISPQGNVVFKSKMNGTSCRVDMSGLRQGLYFVRISDRHSVSIVKFVKL